MRRFRPLAVAGLFAAAFLLLPLYAAADAAGLKAHVDNPANAPMKDGAVGGVSVDPNG